MKVNKEYYENFEYQGRKVYTLEKVDEKVGAYRSVFGEKWFELETEEEIGVIIESDCRASWNRYFNATFFYNGEWKKLCTRADYDKAVQMLLNAYKAEKAQA